MENLKLSVSDFVALTNQTLEYAYPSVVIEGEVASFKVNQDKYVFFDIKDTGASIGCFMTVWQLRIPVEDGMKVIVSASPKLTKWGKFSLTVKAVRPSGEGSIKKSFEMLKAKLEAEGLFAPERKRPLPRIPRHVGVISSTQAAGYADFIKIINDRWGGVQVDVAHTQVQGTDAPDQIIRALKYFNSREDPPQVIVIIRGGGSADDLSCFNDELLAREIAGSRVPTLVGVGHEVDVCLADMVADVRAATPSNAAQLLVPDKAEIIRAAKVQVASLLPRLDGVITQHSQQVIDILHEALHKIDARIQAEHDKLLATRRVLTELDPERVLARGYSLIRGIQTPGQHIEIETSKAIMKAEVLSYDEK